MKTCKYCKDPILDFQDKDIDYHVGCLILLIEELQQLLIRAG